MTNRYHHFGSGNDGGLSRARLARIISVYGANPKRWPADVRDLAPKAIGTNPELSAQVVDELALDEALDSLSSAVEIPDRLRKDLMDGFDRHERARPRFSRRI